MSMPGGRIRSHAGQKKRPGYHKERTRIPVNSGFIKTFTNTQESHSLHLLDCLHEIVFRKHLNWVTFWNTLSCLSGWYFRSLIRLPLLCGQTLNAIRSIILHVHCDHMNAEWIPITMQCCLATDLTKNRYLCYFTVIIRQKMKFERELMLMSS